MPYAQNMGSKEKDTPGNFSEENAKVINNSPLAKAKAHLQKEGNKIPLKDKMTNSSGALSAIGGIVGGGVKAAGKLFSAFSNAGKQYAKHGASKTIALRNAGVKSSKDMRYADKSWTASAIKNNQGKQVPIVGKPGKTTTVPKSSTTKQVSYANPRISMTRAQREAAGY